MKKHCLIVFYVTILFLSLIGCQSNDSLGGAAPTQILSNVSNGVMIATEKEEYPISAKMITVLIQNDSNQDYMTGVHVFLEKKVEDIWYRVPMKASSFTEQGILHPPGELSSLSLKVDDLDYTLTSGEYRAVLDGLVAPFVVVD